MTSPRPPEGSPDLSRTCESVPDLREGPPTRRGIMGGSHDTSQTSPKGSPTRLGHPGGYLDSSRTSRRVTLPVPDLQEDFRTRSGPPGGSPDP